MFYSTARVSELTGATLRQLQWWDEKGRIVPHLSNGSRLYTPEQVTAVDLLVQLRRKGLSAQSIPATALEPPAADRRYLAVLIGKPLRFRWYREDQIVSECLPELAKVPNAVLLVEARSFESGAGGVLISFWIAFFITAVIAFICHEQYLHRIGALKVGSSWIAGESPDVRTEPTNAFWGTYKHIPILCDAPHVKILLAFGNGEKVLSIKIAGARCKSSSLGGQGRYACWLLFRPRKLEIVWQRRVPKFVPDADSQVSRGSIPIVDPFRMDTPEHLVLIGRIMGNPAKSIVMDVCPVTGYHRHLSVLRVVTCRFRLHSSMLEHFLGLSPGALHLSELSAYDFQSSPGIINAESADQNNDCGQYPVKSVHPVLLNVGADIERFDRRYGYWIVFLFLIASAPLGIWGATRLDDRGRFDWRGWLLLSTGSAFWVLALISGLIGRLPWDWWNGNNQEKTYHNSYLERHGESVSQKVLTVADLPYYTIYMANNLPIEKQITIIGSLCEGSSIRSIERLTGVHRDTIMRLGVRVGQGCTALMNAKMRNLSCERLEMDEIWGFVGKKEKHVRPTEDQSRVGDVWTFCAIDADTKLVPSFRVGKRDGTTANAFVEDVAGRMRNRLQISTDGLKAYVEAIEGSFGCDVDYAQIIKTYGNEEVSNNRRYSPPQFVSSEKRVVMGFPDIDLISTSYVERLNATTRLHMRRLTRLTLAFSKKWENFEAAIGLHFAYYNFVKRHGTLRMTPAMAAGVTSSFWDVADLVEASA